MKMTFLRGACTLIETSGPTILTDPWLTDGEYYGSWAHYPPYDWKIDLSGIDYIYVSNIHPDHFSVNTMKRLPKVPVLIHKFQAPFLKANIEALGFEVRELPHNTIIDVNGVKINILAADDCNPEVCGHFFSCGSLSISSYQIDSMMVIEDAKHTLVNVNDCPYQLAKTMLPKIKLQYPQIDLMMCAYGGAGPYPQCFKMPEWKKREEAVKKEKLFISHVDKFAQDLKPRWTFPFAGDYILVGRLAELNEFRGVPELGAVYEQLKTPAVMPIPEVAWDMAASAPLYLKTSVGKKAYINSTKDRKFDYDDDPMPREEELWRLAEKAADRFLAKCAELKFATPTKICVDLSDSMLVIKERHVSWQEKLPPAPYVRLSVDPRLLKRLLQGPKHAHWNNAEIGSHIRFERNPDVFERGLSQVISFLHA